MEHLWSPWRYDYIAALGKKPDSCVFCLGADRTSDRDRLVVFRGVHNFVILNLFPYTAGHLMVAPNRHIATLELATAEESSEMMELGKRGIAALSRLYKPDGFNMGMNLGQAAGAGIREHIHLHVVPRWVGDLNFISVVGETRILPEELGTTWQRLSEVF